MAPSNGSNSSDLVSGWDSRRRPSPQGMRLNLRAPGLADEGAQPVAGLTGRCGNFPYLTAFRHSILRRLFFRRLQRPINRYLFRRREGFAHHVLGELAARDLVKGYDMHGYLGPAQPTNRGKAALSGVMRIRSNGIFVTGFVLIPVIPSRRLLRGEQGAFLHRGVPLGPPEGRVARPGE